MAARARNYSAVLYPESLERYPHWRARLRKTGVPMAISPLHDQDVFDELDELENPKHKAGTPKKPHYHVNIYFGSLKTIEQAHEVLKVVGGVNSHCLQKIDRSLVGANRYLAHMDDPDKAQYDPDEIECINGAVCETVKDKLSKSEQDELRNRLVQVIVSEDMYGYDELYMWAMEMDDVQVQRFVAGHIHFFEAVLKARKFKAIDGI